MPSFLKRHRGFTLEDADWLVGVTSMAGALFGTLLGGLLTDKAKAWTSHQPYLALSGFSMLGATIFAGAAVLVARPPGHLGLRRGRAIADLVLQRTGQRDHCELRRAESAHTCK